MNPLVTVAIPIYNAGTYLDFAICSVLNQSFQNFELILINDGCTDDSVEIMQKYASDPRVSLINDGVNKGLVFRLNESTHLAKGKYYARMDADDIMHPDRLQKQVDYMEEHANVDVLGTGCYIIDLNNKITGERSASNDNWSVNSLAKGSGFVHPSVIGKTSWFVINQYDEDWTRAEDYYLWVSTVSKSVFHNLDESLLFYREVGIPAFSKYYKSQITMFKIWNVKRKLNISFFYALNLLLSRFFRVLIYGFFGMFGRIDFLVTRRSKGIDNKRLIEAEYLIENILQSQKHSL